MAISALILLLFNSLVPNEISAFSPEEREGFPNLVLVSSSTTNQKVQTIQLPLMPSKYQKMLKDLQYRPRVT
jgi:hypothetical protein